MHIGMAVREKNITDQSAAMLAKIIEQLKLLNEKLDSLNKNNDKLLKKFDVLNEPSIKASLNPQADVMTLLTLPASLRKTAMALYRFRRATADEIAKTTGRLRAVESTSANQLVRMGFIKKKREGRIVYFSIEPKLEDEK
jgi:DNA-binding MarR family transcriptional regulator